MILSMTGFAVQHRELGRVSLHIELRSVNSRFLDLASAWATTSDSPNPRCAKCSPRA